MGKWFGTDGVRGVAGEYPLDQATLYKLGKSVAQLGIRSVIIGRDTRASGVWMERILQEGLQSEGAQATLAGVMTTPGIAFVTKSAPFDAGIVISASHNPYQDNGIKIFSRHGTKLSDEDEERIEELIEANEQPHDSDSTGECRGRSMSGREPVTDRPLPSGAPGCPDCVFDVRWCSPYLEFLKQIPHARSLGSLKIVLDCAHGASFQIAPEVFQRLGAEIVAINREPDGCNINRQCGSLYPEQMAERVVQEKAHFGVAFDGDSDRSIFADEQGNVLDGDYSLFILGRHLRDRGKLNSGCIVTTVMANMGLEVALRREGLKVARTRVGDRYVLEEMLRGTHELGGEQSGHIIIREHSLAGDGILTALKIADVMLQEGKPLSELARPLVKFPQVIENVRVREKSDFAHIPEIYREIETAEEKLGERGRIVVRYSGTEPVVRIMLEGEDEAQIGRYAQTIAGAFRRRLGWPKTNAREN